MLLLGSDEIIEVLKFQDRDFLDRIRLCARVFQNVVHSSALNVLRPLTICTLQHNFLHVASALEKKRFRVNPQNVKDYLQSYLKNAFIAKLHFVELFWPLLVIKALRETNARVECVVFGYSDFTTTSPNFFTDFLSAVGQVNDVNVQCCSLQRCHLTDEILKELADKGVNSLSVDRRWPSDGADFELTNEGVLAFLTKRKSSMTTRIQLFIHKTKSDRSTGSFARTGQKG
jgi:hypothetical protein